MTQTPVPFQVVLDADEVFELADLCRLAAYLLVETTETMIDRDRVIERLNEWFSHLTGDDPATGPHGHEDEET